MFVKAIRPFSTQQLIGAPPNPSLYYIRVIFPQNGFPAVKALIFSTQKLVGEPPNPSLYYIQVI